MYDDTGISNPVVTTSNLKKMVRKLRQKPLGSLLGHGYQDGNEAEMLLGAIGAGSGAGLNLDSGLSNRLAQGKCYTSCDVKTSFNYCSSWSGQNSVIPVVCNVPE